MQGIELSTRIKCLYAIPLPLALQTPLISKGTVVSLPPPFRNFTFYSFSYPWSTAVWKRMVLFLTYHWKVNRTLCHTAYVIHLTSSHYIRMYHLTSPQEAWIEYNKILWEEDHIYITFTTVCYYCSILLLVIVVNLLLCLINKVNFIIVKYV